MAHLRASSFYAALLQGSALSLLRSRLYLGLMNALLESCPTLSALLSEYLQVDSPQSPDASPLPVSSINKSKKMVIITSVATSSLQCMNLIFNVIASWKYLGFKSHGKTRPFDITQLVTHIWTLAFPSISNCDLSDVNICILTSWKPDVSVFTAAGDTSVQLCTAEPIQTFLTPPTLLEFKYISKGSLVWKHAEPLHPLFPRALLPRDSSPSNTLILRQMWNGDGSALIHQAGTFVPVCLGAAVPGYRWEELRLNATQESGAGKRGRLHKSPFS